MSQEFIEKSLSFEIPDVDLKIVEFHRIVWKKIACLQAEGTLPDLEHWFAEHIKQYVGILLETGRECGWLDPQLPSSNRVENNMIKKTTHVEQKELGNEG